MVIYEVNLTIDPEILTEYRKWYPGHLREVLEKGMFQKVIWGSEGVNDGKTLWTASFFAHSRKILDDYLKNHAPALREDAFKRFGSKFTARRRILEVMDEFSTYN